MKKSSSKKVVVEKLNKAENFVKRAIEENKYTADQARLHGKVYNAVSKHLGQDKVGETRHIPPEYIAAINKFIYNK